MKIKYQNIEIDVNYAHSWVIRDCLEVYRAVCNSSNFEKFKLKYNISDYYRENTIDDTYNHITSKIDELLKSCVYLKANSNSISESVLNNITKIENNYNSKIIKIALQGSTIISSLAVFGRNFDHRINYIKRGNFEFDSDCKGLCIAEKNEIIAFLETIIEEFKDIDEEEFSNFLNLQRQTKELEDLRLKLNAHCIETYGRQIKSKSDLVEALKILAAAKTREREMLIVFGILSYIETHSYINDKIYGSNYDIGNARLCSILNEKLHLALYHKIDVSHIEISYEN